MNPDVPGVVDLEGSESGPFVNCRFLTLDAQGNFLVGGDLMGEMNMPNSNLWHQGESDLDRSGWIGKADHSGKWLWGTQTGPDAPVVPEAAASDHLGNTYIGGWMGDHMRTVAHFGPDTLVYDKRYTGYIAKLGPDGGWIWGRGADSLDSSPPSRVLFIDVDSNDDVIVGGHFQKGTLSLGGITLTNDTEISGWRGDANYVGKLDSEGNWLWAHSIGGIPNFGLDQVVTDSENNVYVGMTLYEGSGTFAGSNVVVDTWCSLVVAKLSPDGELLWLRQPQSQPDGYSLGYRNGLVVDSEDNLIVGGWFDTDTTFGSIGQTNAYTTHDQFFVSKLSPEGNWLWVSQVKEPGQGEWTTRSYVADLAAGTNGDIYLTSGTETTVQLDSFTLSAPGVGKSTVYVAKMDRDGGWRWITRPRNSSFGLIPTQIVVDPAGNLFLALGFSGAIDFGSFSVDGGNRRSNACLAKLGSEVGLHWEESDALSVSGIDTDADGLADAWEEYFLGDLSYDAAADADGDGLSNEEEIFAGTNPEDPDDTQKVSCTSSNGLALTWMTIPGRRYQVELQQLSLPPEAPWEVLSAYENQTTNRLEHSVILPDRGHPLRARVNLLLDL